MSLPTIEQLPSAAGRAGWPWTAASRPASEAHPGGWPRISVVTASFNQGQFIEQTIRSVLLQGYPNLEYFVLDGGSTDNSVEIIAKYAPWLAGWASQKDGGQPDAINQGWKKSSGEILAWINSDDWYYPDAFFTVARIFRDQPQVDWVAGEVDNCRESGEFVKRHHPSATSLPECLGRKNYGFHQPGMFWRCSLIQSVQGLDPALQCSFTHDFWAKCLLRGGQPFVLPKPIACFRLHSRSKSCSAQQLFAQQDWLVFNRYQHLLKAADARQARQWLKAYQAEMFLDLIYGLLADRKRGQAVQLLVTRLNRFLELRPRKLLMGLLFRTLVSGSAPHWFHGG